MRRWLGHDYARELEGKVERQLRDLAAGGHTAAELKALARQGVGSRRQLSDRLCREARSLDARVDELLEASREADALAESVADYGDANPREREAAESAGRAADRAREALGRAVQEQRELAQLKGHPRRWLDDPTPWALDGTMSDGDMWAQSRAAFLLLDQTERGDVVESLETTPSQTTVELQSSSGPGLEFD
jgi:hypothetical protein